MDEDGRLVKFHHMDDDLKRAENMLRVGGFLINAHARDVVLPRMANAIRLYRDIARAALGGQHD